ncbi:MAG: Rieske (2Fe-2S) protein [Actinomycetota bacterium]
MAEVAKAAEIADGDMKAFDVSGERIVIANVGGSYFAFNDTCTHEGCELSEGELEGMSVICPCHGGTFNIATGEVEAGPPPEPIGVHPVSVDSGTLHVDL